MRAEIRAGGFGGHTEITAQGRITVSREYSGFAVRMTEVESKYVEGMLAFPGHPNESNPGLRVEIVMPGDWVVELKASAYIPDCLMVTRHKALTFMDCEIMSVSGTWCKEPKKFGRPPAWALLIPLWRRSE